MTDRLSRVQVWEYLSLMEERASHPMANAIVKAAASENVSVPRDKLLQKHSIVEGEGIVGVVDGLEVCIGNERMFSRLGLIDSLSEADRARVDSWTSVGGTVGFMSVEGMGIVCSFCVADSVRPESLEVVESFRKVGIRSVMLTGDNRDAALAIGRQVGLNEGDVMFGLLPEDKLREVAQASGASTRVSVIRNPCSSRKLTMMVGDGVNDGPALAVADVSVAMGSGAALSMEVGDITLLDSNLQKLIFAMNMGRRVIVKIKTNIAFSLAVKFTVLGFALAGRTSLWAAIATDVGAMLLVTLNSMMLLPARQHESDVQALKADIESGTSTSASNAASDCKKGCCNSSSARRPHPSCGSTHGQDSACASQQKCGENSSGHQPVATKNSSSSCKKGCCGSSSHSTAPRPGQIEDATPNCKKGCCTSSKQPSPSPAAEGNASSCTKGCCSGPKASILPPVEAEPKEIASSSCKKGCCAKSH
jgi:soluble P-type ATPase